MNGPVRTPQNAGRRTRRWRLYLAIASLLAVLAALALLGRSSIAPWARRSAARHLEAGAIAEAERSLDWAASASPADARTDLLRATCLRRLGDIDAWRSTIEAAEQHGAPAATSELERRLGNLRWGQVENVTWDDYNSLLEAGAAPRDAVHAVVHGMLAKGARDKAQKLIDAWASNSADDGEASFLRGVCQWSAGNLDSAQAEFARTLDRQPRHELAHAALARLLEDQHRYSQALEHDTWLVAVAPHRESARVDLSRILRKVGRLEDARVVLGPPATGADVSEMMALELADVEFESGNYEAAQHWIDRVDLQRQRAPETIRTAATNAALRGDFTQAERLFPRVDDPQGVSRRRDELVRRLALDPNDPVAAQDLQQLAPSPASLSQPPGDDPSATTPAALFSKHCAACHGSEGNGAGRAARHLYPRPRNLRAEPYRLISTLNHIPTLADIEQVIREGIPGASMPSFAKLPADEQRALAEEVLRLFAKRFGAEVGERAASLGVPEEILPVPAMGPSDPESIARGKEIYFRSGCHQCHGDDGTAAAAGMIYDDAGRPTVPRNLVRDPMKGGGQAEALYRRIRLGMPGTPHPASPGLEEAELVALVHYCQSLGQVPKQQLTNSQREMRTTRRANNGVSEQRSGLSPTPAVQVESSQPGDQ